MPNNTAFYIVFYIIIGLCLIPIIKDIVYARKLQKDIKSNKYNKQLLRNELYKRVIFFSGDSNIRKTSWHLIICLIAMIITAYIVIVYKIPGDICRFIPIIYVVIFIYIGINYHKNADISNMIKKYVNYHGIPCELIPDYYYDDYWKYFKKETDEIVYLRFKGFFKNCKCKYSFYEVVKYGYFKGNKTIINHKNYVIYDYDFSDTDILPIINLIVNKIHKTYKNYTNIIKCYAEGEHIIIVKATVPVYYDEPSCKDDLDDILLFYKSINILLEQPDQLC